jgi:hypothetical protein
MLKLMLAPHHRITVAVAMSAAMAQPLAPNNVMMATPTQAMAATPHVILKPEAAPTVAAMAPKTHTQIVLV